MNDHPDYTDNPEENELPVLYRPFPSDCLPSEASEFVEQGSKAVDADGSMVALPLLSCMANCVGSAVRLRVKNTWTVPAILWTCIVAKSGSAKSPAAGLAIDLIKELADEFSANHSETVRQWKTNGGKDDPPPERRIITTNGTMPGLASLLHDNPKGLLYYADELAGWMKDQGRYSANKADESDAWNELYDGKSFWHDRKVAKSLKVRFPNVCVTGGIQPTRLFRIFGQDHLDSGLVARILFVRPPHRMRQLTNVELEDLVRTKMKNRLRDLIRLVLDYENPTWKPGLIGLDPQAYRQFHRFHDDHQIKVAEADGAINAALSKLTEVALRLALVLQLFDDPESTTVCADIMERSIELTHWFIGESERIYHGRSQNAANEFAVQIIDAISTFPGRSIRELQQHKRGLRGPVEEIQLELHRIKKAGLVHSEYLETGGRQKQIWFIGSGNAVT